MPTKSADIFLVEDNIHDIEMTLHALRKSNLTHRIEVARDGEEALDFLLRRGPHSGRPLDENPKLVLLDLKLPKVDGFEVLKHMKADPSTRGIHVVVLSTSNEERDLQECYRIGANSYIVKPMDFEQFAQSIWQLGLYWLNLNQLPPTDTQDGASYSETPDGN